MVIYPLSHCLLSHIVVVNLSTLSHHCHCQSLYSLMSSLSSSLVFHGIVIFLSSLSHHFCLPLLFCCFIFYVSFLNSFGCHSCTAPAIVFVNEKDDEYDCIGSTLKEFFGLISNQVRPDLTKGNNGHWQASNLQCQ